MKRYREFNNGILKIDLKMCLSDLKLNQVLEFTLSYRHLAPSSALPSFNSFTPAPRVPSFLFSILKLSVFSPSSSAFPFHPQLSLFLSVPRAYATQSTHGALLNGS